MSKSSVRLSTRVDPGTASTSANGSPDLTRYRTYDAIFHGSLLLLDIALVIVALIAAYRLQALSLSARSPAGGRELLMLVVTVATVMTVFALGQLYRQGRVTSRVDQLYRICTHVTLGLVIALAANLFLLGSGDLFTRQLMVLSWLMTVGVVGVGRLTHGYMVGQLRRRGIAVDRLLIVGIGQTGQIVFDKIRRTPELGYDVVGFLAHLDEVEVLPRTVEGAPVYGTTERLPEVVRRHQIDELILTMEGTPRDQILDLVYKVVDLPVSIKVYPDNFRLITNDELSIGDLGGLPMITVRTIGLRAWSRVVKRIMDVLVSATVLVVLLPLMILLALLVKLGSPGPIFYVQERVGYDGVTFKLFKFRSMPVDAEAESGPIFTRSGDTRPTRIGRFMRRYSLDELPQFVNVLLGDMSLVGPRPERPYFVERFSQTIPNYALRHREKSGITGWAQVNGLRGDTSIEERTRYDLYYVENWSPLFDLKIMAKTVVRIFDDENAC